MVKETPEGIALKTLVEELRREFHSILAVPKVWLNEEETAKYLSLSTHLLRKWRCQGGGPEYYRIGNRILYNRDLLDGWMQSYRIERDKG